MSQPSVRSVVTRCLREFLDSTGRSKQKFADNTNLVRSLGFSSDEGVDFVLELCDALQVSLPNDFNPFVDDTGQRGLRVSEMIRRVETFVSQTGAVS